MRQALADAGNADSAGLKRTRVQVRRRAALRRSAQGCISSAALFCLVGADGFFKLVVLFAGQEAGTVQDLETLLSFR
jgi:hypothetical protein